MDHARLSFLFHHYINGSCTREEELELIEHITRHDTPEVRSLLEKLWDEEGIPLPEEKAKKILGRIMASEAKVLPLERRTAKNWMKVAAAVTFLLIASVFLFPANSPEQSLTNVETSTAEPANQQFITLPDGSTVILNQHSTLNFDPLFEGSTREVSLVGEAFFNIVHDESKPFIVHTDKLRTTVLGTAFNVRAYPNQNDITVTVTRGKVKVSNDENILGIINPDEQITFHRQTQTAAQQAVASREITAWMEKDIHFDDITMGEAMLELAGRFGVDIAFDTDDVANCRFTGTFVRGEGLDQILDVICAFNGASYKKSIDGKIEISGDGCSL